MICVVCFGEPATFPHILNENWSKLWFLVFVYIHTFSIHLAIRRTPKPLIYWYQCCCWFSRSDQAGRSRTLACGACVVCWFYSSFVFSSLLCLLYLIQITYYLNKNSDTHPSRTTHILCVSKIFITKCDNFCCDVWICGQDWPLTIIILIQNAKYYRNSRWLVVGSSYFLARTQERTSIIQQNIFNEKNCGYKIDLHLSHACWA